MRKITLKLKLTLLYTFFMVLLTCAALAILFSLSSREVLTSAQSKLEKRVQDSLEDIRMRGGELSLDTDFYSVAGDVYLALYDENMYFLYGKVPYGFDIQPELSDGELRPIRDGGREWYVYDLGFRLSAEETVYIRGVTSITDAEASFRVTLRFALILLPALVLLTALIGYRFTRRTLLPVKKITQTVREIREDADLSRRVGLTDGFLTPEVSGTAGRTGAGEGNARGEHGGAGNENARGKRSGSGGMKAGGEKKNGDEIYTLAETFDEMLSELEQVFQREKQFTSDAAHELRTPVSVILAECETLLGDRSLTQKQRDEILTIERKARGMTKLVSQLLFLSRADQGRQPVSREWLNVSELTELTAEEQDFLSAADGRGVRVRTEIRPDVSAWADETFYIRILVNLISNARRYSPDNGEVLVTLDTDGEEVFVCVSDHGPGISEEAKAHIWERFYRADPSRTGEEHSGLGLAMVKWMVEAHGGNVWVESEEGKGSRFRFRIPAGMGGQEPEPASGL